MKRCVALCPELTDGKGIEALDVVQHTVGLRPVRDDGPRVEAETINGVKIVHCYGHGGYGCELAIRAGWSNCNADLDRPDVVWMCYRCRSAHLALHG